MALIPQTHGTNRAVTASPAKSIASILAIVSAIASFVVANAAIKFSLAIAAVLLGVAGMVRATSRHVSGGILSMLAIGIAVIGFLWAILDLVGIF